MNGIGAKLRRAREARGYSQSQIADMTRILVQIVQGLEEEDFSRIVAPIYGRGFVKLYAQAVGLDPAECVREFMEAYSGIPAVEKAPERTEPPPAEEATPVEEPPPLPAEEEEEDEGSAPAEEQQPLPKRRVSRYAPPMPEEPKSWIHSPPPFVWRIALVAVCAVAVAWAAVAGLKALYRATCTPAGEAEAEAVKAAQAPANDAPAPAVRARERKPAESLPDMYAD